MERQDKNIKWGYTIEKKGTCSPLLNQVHGDTIVELNAIPLIPPAADALFTTTPGFTISVFTADCVPVLFYNGKEDTIAAVHAGWRGAKERIVLKTAERIQSPSLKAILGPCILSCCFEVKEDLLRAFTEAGQDPQKYIETRHSRLYFDLIRFIEETQLKGIATNKSLVRCTFCSAPQLPSYRRDKQTLYRIRSWIRRES